MIIFKNENYWSGDQQWIPDLVWDAQYRTHSRLTKSTILTHHQIAMRDLK